MADGASGGLSRLMPSLCAGLSSHLDFLCAGLHLRPTRRLAPRLWKSNMTFLHLHHDHVSGFTRHSRLWVGKVFGRIGTGLRTFHGAIVQAKLRRCEMLFRPDYDEMFPPDQDMTKDPTKFPQRPLILGDKWDF